MLYRKRGEADARLFVTGRDIEEEQELLLRFDSDVGSWIVKGNVNDSTLATTPERQAILDVLLKHPDTGVSLAELAEALKKNINTVRNLLVKLRAEEKVFLQENRYKLVVEKSSNYSKRSNHSNHSNHSKQEGSAPEGTTPTTEVTTVTTPYYSSVVTPIPLADTLVVPVQNNGNGQVTMVTTLTMDTPQKPDFPCNKMYEGKPCGAMQWYYSNVDQDYICFKCLSAAHGPVTLS